MFGTNPLRSLENNPEAGYDGNSLRVQSIWHTIQGEGPFAGRAAVFLRLAGCNLKCTLCDSDFESNYHNVMSVPSIVNKITIIAGTASLIVITGGEPLRQNILPLCEALDHKKFHIQLETAGTTWVRDLEFLVKIGQVSIVCSPKTGKLHPLILAHCKNWKYLICEGEVDEVDGLPNRSTQVLNTPLKLARPPRITDAVWLQPCETYHVEKISVLPTSGTLMPDQVITSQVKNVEQSHRNMKLAAELAMKFNYRISLQLHKYLGLE